MIDPHHPVSSWFLLAVASFFLAVYALPLCLDPLRWARAFLWYLPEGRGTDLTVYFGRCTGALALAVIAFVFKAVPAPAQNLVVFDQITLIAALMTILHAWGAIRRTQPWTETAEIGLYGVTAIAAAWLRIALGAG